MKDKKSKYNKTAVACNCYNESTTFIFVSYLICGIPIPPCKILYSLLSYKS